MKRTILSFVFVSMLTAPAFAGERVSVTIAKATVSASVTVSQASLVAAKRFWAGVKFVAKHI